VLIGLAAAATLLHVFVEGSRWQLTPVYVTVLGLTLMALRHPLFSTPLPDRATLAGPVARAGALTTVILLVASGAMALSLPVPVIEAPEGPWAVGTRSFVLVDSSRDERWSEADDDVRQFPVQVWYPTNATAGTRAPLTERPDVLASAAADWLGLPGFSLSHLGLVTTSSIVNAPLAPAGADPWPVVVYSHGWGGFRAQHLSLVQRLAANGYVVFAIDHTYGALASVFPDGHAIRIDLDTLPAEPPEAYEEAARTIVTTFAGDIQFLVGRVRNDELPMPIGSADLALERIGLVGHSAGGGAAAVACARISSCGAVISFDPWLTPAPEDILAAGLPVPLLSVRSEEWIGSPNDDALRRLHAGSGDQRLLRIVGSVQRDFSMASDLTPLAEQVGLTGATGGQRVRQIVEELTLDTLGRALRGTDPPSRTWPEVEEG
jgi:dienelactone hydrolase